MPFGRQYPIWNKISSCIYKSDKSYGVKTHNEVNVYVGTGSKNSHHFVSHQIRKRRIHIGDDTYPMFEFSVDGIILKLGVVYKDELLTFPTYYSKADIEQEILAQAEADACVEVIDQHKLAG